QRALICVANVPESSMAWIMEGDEQTVLEATDAACRDALAALGDRDPLALIAFDCAARKKVLREHELVHEVGRIGKHARGAPVGGFYTYGEFARTSGVSAFHNQALVVLAVG